MRRIAVVTPGFSADCIETLEELGAELHGLGDRDTVAGQGGALGVGAPAVDHPGDHVVDGEIGGDGGAAHRQRLEPHRRCGDPDQHAHDTGAGQDPEAVPAAEAPKDWDEVIAGIGSRLKAIPDLKWEIKEVLVSGDRVIVLLSSGNLAGTQAVVSLLKQRSEASDSRPTISR